MLASPKRTYRPPARNIQAERCATHSAARSSLKRSRKADAPTHENEHGPHRWQRGPSEFLHQQLSRKPMPDQHADKRTAA